MPDDTVTRIPPPGKPPFEETPEYQSLIADMNARIEYELREMIRAVRLNVAMNPQEVRLAEQKCMNRQTEITLEVKSKIARLKEAYEGESDG